MPFAVLLLLSAEYSRYLTQSDWTHVALAPRTLLLVGIAMMLVWFVLKRVTKQEVFGLSDIWWLGVPVFLALLSVLALAWSSTAETSDPQGYLANFWLYGLFLVLVIALLGRDKKNYRFLVGAALFGAIGVIGVGLWEKITDTHLVLSNLNNPYRQQWSVTSVFIGQNHLAASLAIFLPVLVGWALSLRRTSKILVFALGIGGVLLLFFTGSTLGLMSLLFSTFIFVGLTILRRTSGSRSKKITRVAFGIIGTIVLALVIWATLPNEIKVRFSLVTIGVQQSISERTELVRTAWTIMREQFWKGVGPDGAEAALRLTSTQIKSLHNLILEIGVTFGIPALAFFVAWYVTIFIRKARHAVLRQESKKNTWINIGIVASLASFIFWQSAPSSFEGVRAPFILIGIALASLAADRSVVRQKNKREYRSLKNFSEAVSVVMPAYNEEWRLKQTLALVHDFLKNNLKKFEIIVVSDGSSDGTENLVKVFSKQHSDVRLIAYAKNRGKGYAVRKGLVAAKGDWLVYMDADHSTRIQELEQLPALAQTDGDLFVSSRYLADSLVRLPQPRSRVIFSRIANAFIRILLPGIRDSQNGFKIMRRKVAQSLAPILYLNGWAFDVELLWLAHKRGFKLVEFPVLWENSPVSRLKIGNVLGSSAREYLVLIWRVISGKYKLAKHNGS